MVGSLEQSFEYAFDFLFVLIASESFRSDLSYYMILSHRIKIIINYTVSEGLEDSGGITIKGLPS